MKRGLSLLTHLCYLGYSRIYIALIILYQVVEVEEGEQVKEEAGKEEARKEEAGKEEVEEGEDKGEKVEETEEMEQEEVDEEEEVLDKEEEVMVSFHTNCFSRERDLSQQNRRRSH